MRSAALLSLLATLLATVPAHAEDPPCPLPSQRPMLVATLFFGQSVGGTRLISRRAWARFVADTITPAFPDGFTAWSAVGHDGAGGGAAAQEPTEVVLVAAPDGPDLRDRLRAVSDSYRRRFDQRAVGLVTVPGCAAF